MADERGLAGLDPYDLQDAECERVAAWFGELDATGWAAPSGCVGWSRHELLAHLAAVEEYFAACLSGSVAELMQRYLADGATSLDDFNAAGVAAGAQTEPAALFEQWVQQNRTNRAGFRAADGGDIDSSVGAYPCRQQAFHVAFEFGIHADDAGAPVDEGERDARQDWLAGVARFALTEVKDHLTVEDQPGGFMVAQGEQSVVVSRDAFVAGVSRRPGSETLTPEAAALLDLGY